MTSIQAWRSLQLLPQFTLTVAKTVVGEQIKVPQGVTALAVECKFLYGSGGTTCTVYVQTSLDGGDNWIDIMAFQFATAAARTVQAVKTLTAVAANYTPTDGALTVNTIKDGILGDRIRMKMVSVGTYAGASSIRVSGVLT